MLLALALGQEPHENLSSPPLVKRLQALPMDPAKQSALQAAIQQRNYTGAENLLAEEAARSPKSQPLLLALADVLFLDGKQINTVVVLKKAELLGPLEERSRFLLALSYTSIGRKNLAIAELENLAKSNPRNSEYPYWLSRLAYRQTDQLKALTYALESVRLNPSFMKAHDQLGLCYVALNRNEEAILEFKEAVRLDSEQSLRWPWPSMNLGTLYLRMQRLDEAEVALRQSLAVDPQFPVAHFRLGQVLEKKGRPEEAVQELKESVRLDPTYPEPHYALARIYKRRQDVMSARQELSLFEKLRNEDKRKGITRPD